jgi:hypothetical protein
MTCEGCMKSGFCDLQMNNTTSNCSCQECFLKIICTTDICERLNDFYRSVFKFDHEDYKL